MPKDWKCHKAELERLYIKEGKPLQQVRKILREEYGFDASIRAYRMRIDSWGLRKNKSNKETQHSHRASPDLDYRSMKAMPYSTSVRNEHPGSGRSSLSDDKNANQLWPLRQGPFEVVSAFETLLTRWQPQSETIPVCVHHPDYEEWVRRSNLDHGPILFRLIEAFVPPKDQFHLNKAFLEDDLLCHGDPNYPYNAWRYAWNRLLLCQDRKETDGEECEGTDCSEDWEHAKELLRDDEVVSQVAGERFMSCALVVLAERRLRACKSDSHHWNRRKYLAILKDFRHKDADVDPSFYKDSLQFIELEAMDGAQHSKQKQADLADEYRHKYLQLVNRHTYKKRSDSQEAAASADIVSTLTPYLASDQYPSPDTAASAPRASEPPDFLSSSNLEIPSPVFLTTEGVFETLLKKWRTLNDFTQYAHNIFPHDGRAISIFEPAQQGTTNLFDIIVISLPTPERIPLTSALLVAFSSLTPSALYSTWSLHWWISIYSSPTWETFHSRLDTLRTMSQLERIMTPAAAKLVVDSAMQLVGERLLLGIKTRLVNTKRTRRGPGDPEEWAKDKDLEAQYMAILREFYDRGMKVDQTWTYYLMNIL